MSRMGKAANDLLILKTVTNVTSADREKEMRKIARSTPTRTNASLRTFRRDVGVN
jgi:hypothetical protein